MKNKGLIKTVLILSLSIFFISCKKYLDKKPNTSITTPVSLSDLQALLDDATTMNNSLTPNYGEASADNHFLLQTDYESREDPDKDIYRWIPTVYNYSNDWSRGYTVVYTANYCLEMLDKIEMTSQNEASWKNVKGSALFFRAYNFLNLLWNHGKAYDENYSTTDLGIVLRLGSDFNVPSGRASVAEGYERVINDTKEAVTYLPDLPLHPYRPSKAATYGLLARAYLSMRKYDEALNYASLCLQIKNDLIDCKINNQSGSFMTPQASFPFVQFNKETIFYSEMSLSGTGSTVNPSRARIDTVLYQSYAANDIRKSAFFGNALTTTWGTIVYRFKGSYSGSASYFTGIATNEIYLTRAECYARKGDKTSALNDLNTLLRNRHTATFVNVTATDAADALNKILIERRKELLFRGLRWMDLKRLNKEGSNIILQRLIRPLTGGSQIYTLQPNANYYALPLPTDIINITGMQQNPY